MFLRIPDAAPALVAPTYRRSLDALSRIYSREDKQESTPRQNSNAIIAGAIIAGIIILVILTISIRSLRARHPEPKYIPTPFLKRLWTNWTPSTVHYVRPDGDGNGRWGGPQNRAQGTSDAALSTEPMRSSSAALAVDRHTSVRSVMTLPAYRTQATEAEQVLGVEGERDGIDVVVELPTAEEEEALRDDEMEGLFQIREARRRQAAEREARNQRREQARARHDLTAMRVIRDEARSARTSNADEIEALRQLQDQAKQSRQRAVSSVSYAEVGLVRHDGTRARANSNDSERMGLLSDSASIAALSIAPSIRPSTSLSDRGMSEATGGRPRSTSVLSVETYRSQPGSPGHSPRNSPGLAPSLAPSLSRRSHASSRPRRLSTASSTTRACSSPEMIDSAEADLGSGHLSHDAAPPGYDEVSLSDEPTGSFHNVSRPGSGHTTPSAPSFQEPPPEYPGPSTERRLSRHVADYVAATPRADDNRSSSSSSRSSNGSPQLPGLQLQTLPQIVIEPSTAMPRDTNEQQRGAFH